MQSLFSWLFRRSGKCCSVISGSSVCGAFISSYKNRNNREKVLLPCFAAQSRHWPESFSGSSRESVQHLGAIRSSPTNNASPRAVVPPASCTSGCEGGRDANESMESSDPDAAPESPVESLCLPSQSAQSVAGTQGPPKFFPH